MVSRLLVLALLLSAGVASARAYSLSGSRWKTASVNVHLQLGPTSVALSDGFASWGASAEDALAVWNSSISATHFNVVRDSTVTRVEANRINNVFFSGDIYGEAWGSGVLAVTLTYTTGTSIVEADVLFNNRLSWNSYRGALRSGVMDFHRVALHEFGHALGLEHPDAHGQSVIALMNSHVSTLDGLAADDVSGAQAIYGAPVVAAPAIAAPTISLQPTSRTVIVGQATTFTVGVNTSAPVAYQWLKAGAALTNATGATLTLSPVALNDAGNYSVRVTNAGGAVTSTSATLTVNPVPAPTTTAPTATPPSTTAPTTTTPTASTPTTTTPTAPTTATPTTSTPTASTPTATTPTTSTPTATPTNGTPTTSTPTTSIPTTSTPTSTPTTATPTTSVPTTSTPTTATPTTATPTTVTPTVTTPTIPVAITPVVPPPPTIVVAPSAQTLASGEHLTLSVSASGGGTLTYQWFKDDRELVGATATTFTRAAARPADAGNYRVQIANAGGSVTTNAVTVTVRYSRLVNLSTRAFVPPGAALTPGFYVRGATAKPLLIRAVGPTLSLFGIGTALAEAKLEVIAQETTTIVAANNDWGGGPALRETFARVGAFPLAADSKDAAVQASLIPGGYTTRVTTGDSTTSGITLAEIYDAEPLATSTSQLVNVSTLGFVGPGDQVLTAGFVIGGNATKQVLIRAVGPGLAPFGVSDRLANPQLGLVPFGATEPIASNDDWPNLVNLQAAFTTAGAFALTPGSADAALVITLEPGAYTVIVSGVSGTATGTALVEIYDLDP